MKELDKAVNRKHLVQKAASYNAILYTKFLIIFFTYLGVPTPS